MKSIAPDYSIVEFGYILGTYWVALNTWTYDYKYSASTAKTRHVHNFAGHRQSLFGSGKVQVGLPPSLWQSRVMALTSLVWQVVHVKFGIGHTRLALICWRVRHHQNEYHFSASALPLLITYWSNKWILVWCVPSIFQSNQCWNCLIQLLVLRYCISKGNRLV